MRISRPSWKRLGSDSLTSRLTYYTTDVDRFVAAAREGLGRLVAAGCRPVSTLLGITRLFLPEILVEIEATAMK